MGRSMAEWRERGYVPDSDEEEDSQESSAKESRIRIPEADDEHHEVVLPTSNESGTSDGCHGSPDGARRKDRDNFTPGLHSLNAIDEVQDNAINEQGQNHCKDFEATQVQTKLVADLLPENVTQLRGLTALPLMENIEQNTSRASSPLSEAPSSIPGSPSWLRPQSEQHIGSSTSSPRRSTDLLELADDPRSIAGRNGYYETIVAGRILRHRNAIQLHPYVLEKEKFDQTWRARGLKPVHILQEEAARAESQAEDLQTFQVSGNESGPTSSPPTHTTIAWASQSPRREEVSDADDDDLPDILALLEGTSHKFASSGHKRRKMVPKFRRPPKLPPRTKDIPPVSFADVSLDSESPLFDVPPSPPLSGSRTPVARVPSMKPNFHVPPSITFPTLPTPLTSSEPRKRQSRKTIVDDDSDESSFTQERTGHASEVAEVSSEDEVRHQLQNAQRSIKGVLPASWLKLDLKKYGKHPQQERRPVNAVLNKDNKQRGVARPVNGNASKPSSRPTSPREIFVLSDDDDTEPIASLQMMSNAPSAGSGLLDLDESPPPILWGEAMEDNSVEALLPPAKRSRRDAQHRRNRQKNKLNFGVRRKPMPVKAKATSSVLHSPETHFDRQFQKSKRKPSFRAPKLSILDASGRHDIPKNTHPAFVRVAKRTARSRNDKGKHSPTCKFFRLATREDTAEVNDIVAAWREGSIAASLAEGAQATRKPLHPRSVNETSRATSGGLSRTQKQKKTLIPMAKSVHARLQSGTTRRFQSSLDNLVSRRPPQWLNESCSDTSPPQVRPQMVGRRRSGQLLSTLKISANRRPALLESSQTGHDNLHPQQAFSRKLSASNGPTHKHQIRTVVLDNFLRDEDPQISIDAAPTPKTRRPDLDGLKPDQSATMRPRKRHPRFLDTATFQMQESTAPAIIDELPSGDAPELIQPTVQTNRLRGLGPIGTRYTITFDVTPLPTGTSFPHNTFIGSGNFGKSLMLRDDCDLNKSRGFSVIACDTKTFRWGTWDEIVSSEMGEVFERIEQGTRRIVRSDLEFDASAATSIITLQTAIISYFTSHVSFLDDVDRVSLLQRCKGLIISFWNSCRQSATTPFSQGNINSTAVMQFGSQMAALGLVFANQLRQISEHDVVSPKLKNEIEGLVETSAQQTFAALRPQLGEFEQYLIKCRRKYTYERPLQIDRSVIEAFVITHHIIRRAGTRQLHLVELMQEQSSSASVDHITDIDSSERTWQRLFALLPFLELDEQGALDVGQRFKNPIGEWLEVKLLISPILDIYLRDPCGQAAGFNAYCRCLFSRCLHLINGWGWHRCDSIIGTIFDFFAKNGLGHLKNEDSHGSPRFLEDLSESPPLDAKPEDPCFHLLLKIIGSGIKHMRTLYHPKKIRDLVWRLMPNHGRSHPKEQAVRQEDLDALRNHHDLLCTLHWASPPGFRPSLNGIRTLVDLERSHRQACHINIRAWFNLVKFQLSTDEPVENLEQFTEWHGDLLQQMLRQHRLARTEAEDQVSSAQFVNGLSISRELLESTIAKNQQQVEAVLDDALVCLQLTIGAAKTQKAAALLLSPALSGAFGLFDGSRSLTSGIVAKALDVVLAYTKKCTTAEQRIASHCDKDDSQDYGDWSAFHDDNELKAGAVDSALSPLPQMLGPLRSLVSNCFGADTMPPESFLTKVIDAWVAVSCVLVEDGVKTWEDYLGQFGNDTWHSLRDTDQTPKYAAYFFSSLIEANVRIYRENRLFLMKCWLGSLIERESLLKFQHKLTSSLLNANPNDPLLANLPFWKGSCSGRYSITAVELSDRRLSLISGVLSNMRLSLDHAFWDSDTGAAQLKQEYKDLLKHLMTTMKQNYLELGHGSNTKGAYVHFVHCVVEFLQEHTACIHPVDRFFTDSAEFPLPMTDPNYVVGKLKSYGMRMSDSKMQKELVVFLQSVSERAAVDGQQDYLVEQLYLAMSNPLEESAAETTLCKFVLNAIVSSNLEMAFKNSVGWVFAIPFLRSFRKIFKSIRLGLNSCDLHSRDNCISIMVTFSICIQTAVNPLKENPICLESAPVLKTLTACYQAIIALLPTLDHILRIEPHKAQDHALELVAFFKSFAAYIHAIIAPLTTNNLPPMIDEASIVNSSHDPQYNEIRRFATHELQDTLKKNWVRVEDEYFVIRASSSSSRQQIKVNVGSFEEERNALRLALHDFGDCLSTSLQLGGWGEWSEATKRVQDDDLGYDEFFF